jgi:hypothetical protein
MRFYFMGELLDLDVYRHKLENELTVVKDPSKPDILICMDDRQVDPNCPVMGNGTHYDQLAGGAYGTGHDTAVVMEMRRPGSFVKVGKPIFAMGGLVAKCVETDSGLILLNHFGCTAQQTAKEVDTSVVESADEVYESAKLFKPDLDEVIFEQVVAATNRLLKAEERWTDPHKALRKLEQGHPASRIPAIPAAKLVDHPHNAKGYAIEYRRGMRLNVVAANEHGLATYYSSAARIEDIAKGIQNMIPVRAEDLLNVYAVRLGAIRAKHLKSDKGEKLPVVLLAA